MDKKFISQLNNLKNIQPRKDWVSSNRELLLSQISSQVAQKEIARKGFLREMIHLTFLQPRFVKPTFRFTVAMLLILAISFGGGIASVSASRGSMPGDFLYPIKITIEKAQVGLSAKKEDKAKLEVEFAARRIEEVDKLAEKVGTRQEKKMKVKKALSNFKDNLATATKHLKDIKEEGKSKQAVKLAVIISNRTEEFLKVLNKQKNISSDTVKEALDTSKDASEKAMDVIIEEHKNVGEEVLPKEEVAKKVGEKISEAEKQVTKLEKIVETADKNSKDSNKNDKSLEAVKNDNDNNEQPEKDDSDANKPSDNSDNNNLGGNGDSNGNLVDSSKSDKTLETAKDPKEAKKVLEEAKQLLEQGDFAGAFLKVKESNQITKNVIEVVGADAVTDSEDAENKIIDEEQNAGDNKDAKSGSAGNKAAADVNAEDNK